MNKQQLHDLKLEYQTDLRISKFKLEEAALNQPLKMGKWGIRYALASGRVQTLEHELSRLKDDKRITIKSMSSELLQVKFGFNSLTEPVINSLINRDVDVAKKAKELVSAKVEEAVYKAAEKAASQRYGMIRTLTDQYVAQYWSRQSDRPSNKDSE